MGLHFAKSKRILFMPDSINGEDSGAHSARATVKYLHSLGYTVAIYAKDALLNIREDVKSASKLYGISTGLRWYEFIYSPLLRKHFISVIEEFQPDYIFFAGGIQKPAVLAREARKRSIKTVYLFYINDFFCQRIYAGTEDGPCAKCNSGWQIPALTNGCLRPAELPVWIKGSLTRYFLGREIRRSHRVLGYGREQIETYRRFGLQNEQLALVGFQFDPSELQSFRTRDEGYFVLTGQPIVQKGWHLLSAIFSKLTKDVKVKVSFKDEATALECINKFELRPFVESGALVVVTGLGNRELYLEFLASARAVLLPSYYPTTGEFVLQESMFLGKPVHVFAVGAHKDVLTDGYDAMVSPMDNVDDYAAKINEIDRDKEKRKRIGLNAKRCAQDFYSLEKLALLKEVFD